MVKTKWNIRQKPGDNVRQKEDPDRVITKTTIAWFVLSSACTFTFNPTILEDCDAVQNASLALYILESVGKIQPDTYNFSLQVSFQAHTYSRGHKKRKLWNLCIGKRQLLHV